MTAAEWVAQNPVLAESQVGVESDTGQSKVGNAASPWVDLPYNNAALATLPVAVNSSLTVGKNQAISASAASGPIVLTLPNVNTSGLEVSITKTDTTANAVTVQTSGSWTFANSATSFVLTSQGDGGTWVSSSPSTWVSKGVISGVPGPQTAQVSSGLHLSNATALASGFYAPTNYPNLGDVYFQTGKAPSIPAVIYMAQPGNVISYEDATFIPGLGQWGNGGNGSISLSSAEALDGTESLAVSATAAGNTLAYGTTYSIVGGASYVWMGAMRAAATARTFEQYVNFKDSSGTYISNIAATASDDTGGWTYAIGVGPAPSNAATAYLSNVVEAAAASELHYLDNCGIFPGDTLGYQLEVLSDGPSAYFPLTDGPGSLTAANAVGSGVGTVTGGVTFGQPGVVASDPSQTAAMFDGTTGYVTGPSTPAGTALTFEGWINADAVQPPAYANRVLSAGGGGAAGAEFIINGSGGALTFSTCDGTHTAAAATPPPFPAGSWHHVVGVYDGTNSVSIYLDGVLVQSVSSTVTSVPSKPLVMARFSGGGDLFAGAMSQVAVYPTALTAARIQAHYQAALNTSGSIVQKWTRGGLAGTTTAAVTRTGQNAGTVATVPLPAPSQAAAITDNAVEFGADITYTAVVQATV